MKKVILLLMLISTGTVLAQVGNETKEEVKTASEALTENQNRIAEIPNLMEEAVKAENYQEAANLQEELKIRKKIEVAKGNQDYDRIVELEKQLENCNCKPKPQQDCVAEKNAVYQKELREKEASSSFVQKRKFLINVDFSPAGYLYANEIYNSANENVQVSRFTVSHAVGASVFFGDMNKDLKVGLDVNFMDMMLVFSEVTSPTSVVTTSRLAFAQPGVIMTKYFSNGISGIDIKANIGTVIAFRKLFEDFWGLNTNAQMKFWYKKTAFGIKYQFGSAFDNSANYHHVGLTLGLRL